MEVVQKEGVTFNQPLRHFVLIMKKNFFLYFKTNVNMYKNRIQKYRFVFLK